jgi:iron-sulfur cluster assembly protein
VKKAFYIIFVVNLDKINIDHDKSFWYCQKKIIDLMQDDGFDAATDYVRVGEKRWLLWLWFKIWQEQGDDDKIFIDNDITIAVEKNLFIFSRNHLEFSGGINGKGFVFNNPNATRTCGCGESFSYNQLKLNH